MVSRVDSYPVVQGDKVDTTPSSGSADASTSKPVVSKGGSFLAQFIISLVVNIILLGVVGYLGYQYKKMKSSKEPTKGMIRLRSYEEDGLASS